MFRRCFNWTFLICLLFVSSTDWAAERKKSKTDKLSKPSGERPLLNVPPLNLYFSPGVPEITPLDSSSDQTDSEQGAPRQRFRCGCSSDDFSLVCHDSDRGKFLSVNGTRCDDRITISTFSYPDPASCIEGNFVVYPLSACEGIRPTTIEVRAYYGNDRITLLVSPEWSTTKIRLYGEAGDDEIFGRDGPDFLQGGAGNDRLWGLEGVDRLEGDFGDDLLDGGEGNDVLYGGPGRDTLYGDRRFDLVSGPSSLSSSNDFLFGGDGNDCLRARSGGWLFGENGNDDIAGKGFLYGGPGDDELRAVFEGERRDCQPEDGSTLHGDAGNDLLLGYSCVDWLFGDEGTDILNAGESFDHNHCGGGMEDILVFGYGDIYDIYDIPADRCEIRYRPYDICEEPFCTYSEPPPCEIP